MEKRKTLTRLLCAAVLVPALLQSQFLADAPDGKLRPFDHFGGWPGGSAIQGNHAYLIQATALTVLDITGSEFKRVGYLTLPEEPSDIVIRGGHAFLIAAQSDSGLQVVDISDPVSPELKTVAALETGWPVRGFLSGDRIYVANGENLQIVDVSNPEIPALKAEIEVDALDVFVQGNLAYVGGSDGLRIYDVSNPADPELRSFFPGQGVHGVFVRNGRAFCLGYRSSEPRLDLAVVNVADSTKPSLAGHVTEITGAWVNTGKPGRISVADGIAYLGAGRKFYTFDVSNSSNPSLKGVLEFTEGSSPDMQSLQVIPPHAFAAMGTTDYGFVKIGVTDPAKPSILGTLIEPWDVTHIFARGTDLFVASAERLFVFDYADPSNPELAGHSAVFPELYRIHVDGNTLFGIDHDSLHIVDVSNPSDMTRKGGCALPAGHRPRSVSAHGSHAFLLTVAGDKAQSRLDILDVSDPVHILWKGNVPLSGEARDLFVPANGGVAYVAFEQSEANRGILTVRTENPDSPALLGTGQASATPSCIWVSDTLAFVGSNHLDGSSGTWTIDVFNVADPSVPLHAGGTSGNGLIADLEVDGTSVFASIQGGSVYYFEMLLEQREFMLELLEVCHSPASIFIAIIYYAHMTCPLTCDGAWSPMGMMTSASFGVFIQAILKAVEPVEAEGDPRLPSQFLLQQNYPNPFNPLTTIDYEVKEKCRITLKVYDIRGREVAVLADGERMPWRYSAVFNARNLPSGEYFCRIRMKDYSAVRKMVLVE